MQKSIAGSLSNLLKLNFKQPEYFDPPADDRSTIFAEALINARMRTQTSRRSLSSSNPEALRTELMSISFSSFPAKRVCFSKLRITSSEFPSGVGPSYLSPFFSNTYFCRRATSSLERATSAAFLISFLPVSKNLSLRRFPIAASSGSSNAECGRIQDPQS